VGAKSGLELGAFLASQYPALPIILVGKEESALPALRHGFWDFLPAPFEQAQVINSVRQVLARTQRMQDPAMGAS
jgi:FixJ family two-component response regulator